MINTEEMYKTLRPKRTKTVYYYYFTDYCFNNICYFILYIQR